MKATKTWRPPCRYGSMVARIRIMQTLTAIAPYETCTTAQKVRPAHMLKSPKRRVERMNSISVLSKPADGEAPCQRLEWSREGSKHRVQIPKLS